MRTAVLSLFVIQLALGLCSQANPRACIRMTPEKEEQIDKIIDQLGSFLSNLTIKYEDFDIRLIRLEIDQHSEDEVEEKETVLQLSVNDCQNDAVAETNRQEEAGQSESERDNDNAKSTNGKKPKLMYLELGENGQKLLEVLNKKAKKPRLVYVQKDAGQLNYMFLNKK